MIVAGSIATDCSRTLPSSIFDSINVPCVHRSFASFASWEGFCDCSSWQGGLLVSKDWAKQDPWHNRCRSNVRIRKLQKVFIGEHGLVPA